MSPFQCTLFCIIFIIYLIFGGCVFMYFERQIEIEKNKEIFALRQDVTKILILLDRKFYHNNTPPDVIHALTTAKLEILQRISLICGIQHVIPFNASDINSKPSSSLDKLTWSFCNSVFFSFIVITTIGYGRLSPSSSFSKIFLIFYAVVGIPLNSILINEIGQYFSNLLKKIYTYPKTNPRNRCALLLKLLIYLLPGTLLFILTPAVVFVYTESWTYNDAVYYVFVTLTTIGFGDYVAGAWHGKEEWLHCLYKIMMIFWIILGVSYFTRVLSFIAKSMTHKKTQSILEIPLRVIRYSETEAESSHVERTTGS